MFYFNSDKFDFWVIYEAIKQFYPIGINRDESKMYFSYPGIKKLENILIDSIHDNNHFSDRWEKFTKELYSEIGKEVIGTTYGQAPSFSSYVLLETTSIDNLVRTKELHFFVSLIGPFYTIIGQDNNTVKLAENKNYRSTSYLVLSPENEYADTFQLLCNKIEDRFTGFRFVPFEICQQAIEGLNVRYSDENLNFVFHALFNDQVDLNLWRKIGNGRFKAQDWVKKGCENTVGDQEIWSANV